MAMSRPSAASILLKQETDFYRISPSMIVEDYSV